MPNTAKYPCIICQQNVSSNSIACSVCGRWCHVECSDLNKEVLKYFMKQKKEGGSHSWSCQGCDIAYTALNNRVRLLEAKQRELEDAIKLNSEENLKSSKRLDVVEGEVKEIKQSSKRDKEAIITEVNSSWSRELREREARKGNIVIYGLKEHSYDIKAGEERQAIDKRVVGDMFREMKAKVDEDDVKFAARIGKLTPAIADKPRPLKMSFRDLSVKESVFNAARNLPRTRYNKISIVPDLTDLQRKEDQDLNNECDEKNAQLNTEDALNFEYRCIGRRGERVICYVRRRPNETNRSRAPTHPGQVTRNQPHTATLESETETETETSKRGRETSEGTDNETDNNQSSPQTRNKRKKKKKSKSKSPSPGANL